MSGNAESGHPLCRTRESAANAFLLHHPSIQKTKQITLAAKQASQMHASHTPRVVENRVELGRGGWISRLAMCGNQGRQEVTRHVQALPAYSSCLILCRGRWWRVWSINCGVLVCWSCISCLLWRPWRWLVSLHFGRCLPFFQLWHLKRAQHSQTNMPRPGETHDEAVYPCSRGVGSDWTRSV